jgi:hypothetical protein
MISILKSFAGYQKTTYRSRVLIRHRSGLDLTGGLKFVSVLGFFYIAFSIKTIAIRYNMETFIE